MAVIKATVTQQKKPQTCKHSKSIELYVYVYLQDFKQAQNSSPDVLHGRLCCGVSLRNLQRPWTHQRATGHLQIKYEMEK